jgi:hypothetical protein
MVDGGKQHGAGRREGVGEAPDRLVDPERA